MYSDKNDREMLSPELLGEVGMTVWKKALERSRDIYKLKPWEVLLSDDIFAIDMNLKGTEEAITSFMGQSSGEHSIQFFIGDWGKWGLAYLFQNEAVLSARLVGRILSRINSMRIDYMRRDDVPDDYARLTSVLGLHFRGNYPVITVFEPTKEPSLPSIEDLEQILFMLDQVHDVIRDLRARKIQLTMDDHRILKRYWSKKDCRWLYKFTSLEGGLYIPQPEALDELTAHRLKRLPAYDGRDINVDLLRINALVRDEDGSPRNYYMFVGADGDSGYMLHHKLWRADQDEMEAWRSFLTEILDTFGRPEVFIFDDEIAYAGMEPFLNTLDLKHELVEQNPLFDFLFDDFESRFV